MALTEAQRNKLVVAYFQSRKQTTSPYYNEHTHEEIVRFYAEQDRMLDEYGELLPFAPMGRCPLCDTVLEYPFDRYGFDGPWWFKGKLAEYPAPNGCEHFRVLLGAVDLHGRVPREAAVNEMVYLGPGRPFVVPNILNIDTMTAVAHSMPLPHGDTAYIISYFSQTPVHGGKLQQPWAREAYEVYDEDGNYAGWFSANHPMDFDLARWISATKLWWIEPGDTALTLRNDLPCPYEGCTGIAQPQVIERGEVKLLPMPDGVVADPFE